MPSSHTPLEAAIIKTLAYFQAFNGSALSLVELKRYFLNEKKPSLHELIEGLSALLERGLIRGENGFWALSSDKNLLQERMRGTKEAALKWKRTAHISGFLPLVPFVRVVAITGSVALNNAQPKSDIDVLLSCAPRRIWTTRFLVTAASLLLGRRRYGKHITNRLCFNHYTTSDTSTLGPENVHTVVRRIAVELWRANNTAFPNASRFALAPSPALLFLKHTIEKAFNLTRVGDGIEYMLGRLQMKKIASNEASYPPELPQPSLASSNLIFYYPRVQETERTYEKLLASHGYGSS